MTVVWLASASPRRRQLLGWAGIQVHVAPADIDETPRPGEPPEAYAERLAAEKVSGVPTEHIGLAADTVVHREGRIFDKPAHRDEARAHLQTLSGGWHAVTTAVAMQRRGERVVEHCTTRVRFRDLSSDEIGAYLETGEADDKAGAYGIQGRAGAFVAEVQGSWTNVMGLPLEVVVPRLRGWLS